MRKKFRRAPLCRAPVSRTIRPEPLEPRVLMAAGYLDPSLDGDGRLALPGGTANAVAVQSDGKIVTAGGSEAAGGDFLVYRFNADGSPDATFGLGGVVGTDIGGRADVARAVALQGDGKIIVAGTSGGQFALVRYNSNGSPDGTFGTNGVVATPFGADATIWDIAIQADGKIVAAGSSSDKAGAASTFALARYNTDGSLDTSFDGDGMVTTGFGLTSAYSVALTSDGKIVAGGVASTNQGDAALARYDANGSLDPIFNFSGDHPGIVGSAFEANSGYDDIRDVALAPDDSIVVAGRVAGHGFAVQRFDSLALSWRLYEAPEFASGPGGGAANDSAATSITFDTEHRVLAAGYTMDATGRPENFALVRYLTEGLSDGVVDRSFGFRGTAVTDFRTAVTVAGADPQDAASGIGLAPGGSLVVAGASGGRGVVARYLGAADTAPAPVTVSADNALAVDGTAGADDVRLYPWAEAVPRFAADLNGSLFLAPRGVGRARLTTLAGNDSVQTLGGAFNFPVEADGGAGNDTITGGGGDDSLYGRDGNDVLTGGAGNDTLVGDAGADIVFGGDGDDVIIASAGTPAGSENNYYSGGRGTDSIDYSDRSGRMLIKLGMYATQQGRRGRDTLREIEGAVGGSGDDRIEGDRYANRLLGGGGNDVLLGGGGNDSLIGGAGDDVLTDTIGTNSLDGGEGNDTINGVRDVPTSVLLEAEDATIVGASVGRANAGYTGTGYVDYNAARNEYVEWTFDNTAGAGTRTLSFRYANGGGTDRPLELKVNGAVVRPSLSFPATTTWTDWRTVTITVQLTAGTNKIRLTSIGQSGGNIDSLTIS